MVRGPGHRSVPPSNTCSLGGGPMPEPAASRPHMPGYGIAGPAEGRGLLPWSWTEDHVTKSHDYCVPTTRANGRPHLRPAWAVWDGGAVWVSRSVGPRKARNLPADPH